MTLVAIAGQAFPLRVELESQAAAGTFQSSPTVASGDVKLLVLPATLAGTEAFANSTNAPTVLNGVTAQVIIAAAETTAAGDGGEIIAVWADAAGDEWYSLSVHIPVKAADLSTLGGTAQTGDAYAVVAHTDYGNAKLVRSTTPANTLDIAEGGEASANVTMQAGVLIPGPLALESTAQAILEDTGTTLPGLIAAVGGGAGAITFTYTLTNSDGGAPIGDADVWVTSDETGSNVVASGRTDQYGVVTFYLDAGTVYIWRQKGGWVFVNPDVEVVS